MNLELRAEDWQRLCAAYGESQGRCMAYERMLAERDAEIDRLRALLEKANGGDG